MRVLYVSHTGHMSGGEHSLLDLLRHLPRDIAPALASPGGELADSAAALDVPVLPLPAIDASLRLTPQLATRGVAELVRLTWSVRRRASEFSADLLHANSIRAGIAASHAVTRRERPVIVHVRDCLPAGRLSSLSLRLATRRAAAVAANSRYTAARVARACPGVNPRVVYSPVDLERFDPAAVEREQGRRRLQLRRSDFVLAVVAQLTPWKGQDDAVRILATLKRSVPDARLLLVGSTKFVSAATRHDNRAFVRELESLIASLGVERQVTLLGERDDVPAILAATDVLLVPSWEEPFGRAVIEGMAMGLPVVATRVGGPAEIIEDGRNGVLLPPGRPELWAAKIEELASSPERRRSLGDEASRRAISGFGVDGHVAAVLRLYSDSLQRNGHRDERGGP